jgi:hypothetical protein
VTSSVCPLPSGTRTCRQSRRSASSESGQIDTAERQPASAGGNRQPLEHRLGDARTAPSRRPPTSVDGQLDNVSRPTSVGRVHVGSPRFLRCSQQLRPLRPPGAWLHGTASAPPWTETSLPRPRPHEALSLRFDSRVCPALESSTQPGSDFGPFRVRAPAVGLVPRWTELDGLRTRSNLVRHRNTTPGPRASRQGSPPPGGVPQGIPSSDGPPGGLRCVPTGTTAFCPAHHARLPGSREFDD